MNDENEEELEETTDDKVCPECGLRQYGNKCFNCDIILENEEKEKTKDDDDEYDRRERK
ncbi:MAG: hypothetical protein ABH951_02535 [Patescibacteria group bacterium]